MAVLCFEPPFGGLGTTYDDHLRLIGKRVVDLLLLLNVNVKTDLYSAIKSEDSEALVKC